MIRIHPISGNKKQYLDLLLLADEQESMIDRYLERGEMFILSDNDTVKASCVITCEDKGIYEIKSIAVYPEYQRQGYGRQLIAFVLEHYVKAALETISTNDCKGWFHASGICVN